MNEKRFLNQFLKTRKLNLWDKITLIAFFLTDIVCALIAHASIENSNRTKAMICLTIPFIAFFLINSTSFGNRFTNFTFSITWFILSVCFVLFGSHIITGFNLVPLLEFALYQIFRLSFWKKYDKEFIPADINRNVVSDHFNKIEQRMNNEDDKRYMKYLLWTGMAIFFICIFSLVGLHLL